MPAASPGIYQALGMHFETTLVLPELIQAAPSVEREALVQLVEADHQQWPELQASPHSTPTLQECSLWTNCGDQFVIRPSASSSMWVLLLHHRDHGGVVEVAR